MLTPLRHALGAWAPGNGRSLPQSPQQALGAILSLWTEIVGEDVARNAQPLERSGDALLVLVASSAWSNQLSLLSGRILGALSEAGIGGIERLRFRIGRFRRSQHMPSASARASLDAAHAAPGSEKGPATTLDEAFSRLRERIGRERDAKRAVGWKQCHRCGAMLPEGDRCAPCATAEASVRSARVQRLMFDVPWLGFRGIADLVEGLTREEYDANRGVLLARWWETLERARKTGKLNPNGYERQVASSYLLLKTGWEPDRVTPAIARNELGDDIYMLIYGKYHQP